MGYTLQLDHFEGPLELLLRLIEEERLDITTISLARVTDQYLAYIEQEDGLPPDEIADFLVVAAKLIYIKSKYLLPDLEEEPEDGIDLEQQLKMYREFYRASKAIQTLIGKKKFAYIRVQPLKLKREEKFSPPPGLTAQHMLESFELVIGKLDRVLRLPKILLKTTVSIREKINHLKDALAKGMLRFHSLYDKSNKQDIIVSFLAMLEMVKMRHIEVDQDGLFTEIIITKRENV